MAKDKDDGAVNYGIAAPALLVRRSPAVADHRNHESVLDAPTFIFVARNPSNCADRGGCKQETVAVARPRTGKLVGKMCEQCHTRASLIGARGMANMGRQ